MKRNAGFAWAACILLAAVSLRLAGLALRPMHHDEANQALKFGSLLERGEYRYDPSDHHGPSLYYLTLPLVRVAGISRLADLNESDLRRVSALFGSGIVLLLLLLFPLSGVRQALAAALLAALSPVMVYYSRDYIQEIVLVFFLMAFLAASWGYLRRPGPGRAFLAGLLAGGMIATKETALISIGAASVAALFIRPQKTLTNRSIAAGHLLAGLGGALVVIALLYTSFGRNIAGMSDALHSVRHYLARAGGSGHSQPWYAYLRMLAWYRVGSGPIWSEALVLVLAAIGAVAAIRPVSRSSGDPRFSRFILLYTAIATAAYSAVPYKTPWNLLPFYAGFILLAGSGVTFLLDPERKKTFRLLAWLLLAAGLIHLGYESIRANFVFHSDPNNPYVYAQTVPDYQRLIARIEAIARFRTDGRAVPIQVVAGPYETWPLPWSLRRFTRVGYWTDAADCVGITGFPLIIASLNESETFAARLESAYVSEYYGLRPGVLLHLFIERGLWDRFVAREQK